MNYYIGIMTATPSFEHFGLKGMRWGRRRWQYDDGRFNPAGKERYFGDSDSHTQTIAAIGGGRRQSMRSQRQRYIK